MPRKSTQVQNLIFSKAELPSSLQHSTYFLIRSADTVQFRAVFLASWYNVWEQAKFLTPKALELPSAECIRTELLILLSCIACYKNTTESFKFLEFCLALAPDLGEVVSGFFNPERKYHITKVDISIITASLFSGPLGDLVRERGWKYSNVGDWTEAQKVEGKARQNKRATEFLHRKGAEAALGGSLYSLPPDLSTIDPSAPMDNVLQAVVHQGDSSRLKELLVLCDITKLKNNQFFIPLSMKRDTTMLEILEEKGLHINWMPYEVNISDPGDRRYYESIGVDVPVPVLHWMSEFGTIEDIKWLLDNRAHASIKDGRWWDALRWSDMRNHGTQKPEEKKEIIDLLREAIERERVEGVNSKPLIKRTAAYVQYHIRPRASSWPEPPGEDWFG